MSIERKRLLYSTAAGVLLALAPSLGFATNGMNMIGYGAVSSSMGGAALGVVDNASAMNINPAGICECSSPEVTAGLSLLMPFVEHEDALGNDEEGEPKFFPLPFLAYVHPLRDTPLTLGVGLFAQGGMGAEFEDLATPFGTEDDTFTNVMYLKLTPTLAWRVSPALTVGASLNVGYASTEMRLFPDTSTTDANPMDPPGSSPQDMFFGMDLRDLWTMAYGYRVGAQYRLGPVTLGAAYLSKTKLDFDRGTMTLDMSSMGLGNVDYDAEMDGFGWPEQAGVGVGYRVTPWLTLAADLSWINWSEAMEKVKIKISNPDAEVPPGMDRMTFPFTMDWRDQWVLALGTEIRVSPAVAVRLGYNHGNSPVPDATVTPLFPAIIEDHLTGGVGVKLGLWTVDLGLEYAFEAKQTNKNPSELFGMIESTERHSQLTTHVTVRRAL